MNEWVTNLWSMIGATSLSISLLYFYVWCHRRRQLEYLCLSVAALSATVFTLVELQLMSAASIAEYEAWLYWLHLPGFFIVTSLTIFVRLRLGAGRWWLAAMIIALRCTILVLIYVFGINIHYNEINDLRQIGLWFGQTLTVAHFAYNPLSHIDDASILLLVVFVIDAGIASWGRGDNRRALVLPAAIMIYLISVGGELSLVYLGLIDTLFVMSTGYIFVIIVASWELANDILRSAALTESLKRRESELAENQKRMTLAADAANLGMWVWDIATYQFWSTDRGRILLGIESDAQFSVADFLDKIHPEDRLMVRQAVDKALKMHKTFAVEYRLAVPQGVTRWVALHGQVESVDHGQHLRMLGVLADITERKDAEFESMRSRAEITHLSRVTLLGELSSSIAHELNQPLTAILSNAEAAECMLESGSLDLAELREILADIVEQDVRAGEVIRRLRVLMKKREIEVVALDVNDLVRESVTITSNDMINRGVKVITELDPGLREVFGDRVQLQQVILNLIVNACDAMVDTPVAQRTLTIRSGDDEPGYLKLCFIDCGCGIPADMRDKVFESFYTTKAYGLGVGLAVSRTIVQAHHGRIWVQNNAGQGTEVCFSLPVCQEGGFE